MISIQTQDFDQHAEYLSLAQRPDTGAIVTFVGRVRDLDSSAKGLLLEHYAGMTEKVLVNIVTQARQRWELHDVRIIHRIGELAVNDQIVFVGVSAQHRKAAFAACEFIMDFLKTQAPFWKKEGDTWVAAKESDTDAADQWLR